MVLGVGQGFRLTLNNSHLGDLVVNSIDLSERTLDLRFDSLEGSSSSYSLPEGVMFYLPELPLSLCPSRLLRGKEVDEPVVQLFIHSSRDYRWEKRDYSRT